jgi:CheY-like chemotaxis protein
MPNGPVLLAEDEENDVLFMRRAFKAAAIEHPLVAVTDGQFAIDYLSGAGSSSDRPSHPLPCLLLLDLNMPRKSGLEVLGWVRAHAALAALPVVILTASSQESDVRNAYAAGANGYLVKPRKTDELLAIVKAMKEFWLTHNRVAE